MMEDNWQIPKIPVCKESQGVNYDPLTLINTCKQRTTLFFAMLNVMCHNTCDAFNIKKKTQHIC